MTINLFQTCYDLLNQYIFGGIVVVGNGTYQDLVLTLLATIGVIFCISIPFIVVYKFIKVLVK